MHRIDVGGLFATIRAPLRVFESATPRIIFPPRVRVVGGRFAGLRDAGRRHRSSGAAAGEC
jgi:hypothetical protein